MSGINMSKTTTTTTGVNDVVAPAPRLIDLDSNVTTYLKRVFVFGDPGSGTGCATAWLQQMGYKVYDIAEAAKNHERDFPLWLEAVQLQQAGKPYNQSDYDKFLGKYHAVVGMPATFCAEEFIKAYPYAKFIVITKHPDPLVYADYYTYVRSAFLSFVDPDFFGLFSTFLKTIKTDVLDQQMVRSSIRNPNHLLEVESLDCKTMCNFLDMPMPKESVADKFEDAALGVFKDRCQEITSRVGANIVNGLNYCAMAMSVAVAASFYASYTDTDVHLGSTIAVAIMLLLAIRSVMSTKPEPEPVVVASPPAVATKAIGASPPVVAQPIQHGRWQQGRNQQGRNQQGRNQQGRNQQGRNQKGHGQQPRGRRAPHNRNKSTSSSESKGSSNTVWTVASATTGASSVKPDSRPTTPPRPTPFVAKRSPLRNATVYPADSHISTPTGAKVVTPVAAKVTTPTVKVVTPSTAKVVTPAAKVITPAAKVVTPATATVVTPSAARVAAPITRDAIKPVAAPTATPAAAPVSVRQRPAMTGAWAADSFYSAIRNRDTTKFVETIAKNEAMKDVKVEFITNYKPRRPRV